jgi:hypothetical protein
MSAVANKPVGLSQADDDESRLTRFPPFPRSLADLIYYPEL